MVCTAPGAAAAGQHHRRLLGEMTLLRYFQDTAGMRTDIETSRPTMRRSAGRAMDAALAEGRAVFITRPLPGLAERMPWAPSPA